MADREQLPQDLAWYQDQWEELMDLLPASAPEEVVDHVRELQVNVLDREAETLDDMGLADADEAKTVLRRIFERLQRLRRENQSLQRAQNAVGADDPGELVETVESLQDRVRTLEDQQAQLSEAGFEHPVEALAALQSMEEQLDLLYEEKEATEATDVDTDLKLEGDTFDQLQALLAREEKLQRELGISNPEALVEMVEGLSDQLNELYEDRDATDDTDSIFAPSSPSSDSPLEEELGMSDPDTVSTMVEDLTEQLEALYSERERLGELDLERADDAVEMVRSMQLQLESLYEHREELSEHGIRNIRHALSMIDSMGEQLSELYDERYTLATEKGLPGPDEAAARLDELEEELSTLLEEKNALREKRNRLEKQLNELRNELDLDDPEAIPDLVESLQQQLEDVYTDRENETELSPNGSAPEENLLDADTLTRLHEMDADALNALPVGLFRLDKDGTVRWANQNALRWPDVATESAEALIDRDFFSDLAPGTNNTLFRGRFTGDEMDDQFTYTYVSEDAPPTNLAIQLYSSSDSSSYWIAFSVLEQY